MPLWQATAALTIADRQRGAGAFAEPHAEIEQRPSCPAGAAPPRGRFRPRRARRGNGRARARRARARTAAAAQTTKPSSSTGTRWMRAARIAPAIAAISRPPSRRKDFERIVKMLAMQRDGRAHRVGLAFQTRVVDAGAAADPILRLAAVERVIDRRRRGGVADAHFAQAEQVGLGGERLHAERHRRGAGPLVERRLARDVAGRPLERELEHLQRNVEGLADLIDRRAAGGEIGDHRLGDRGRDRPRRPGRRRRDCRRTPRPAAHRHAAAPPCQPARNLAMSSSRPSEPAGLVSSACRARAASSAAASGSGMALMSARKSSKGRGGAFILTLRGRPPSEATKADRGPYRARTWGGR